MSASETGLLPEPCPFCGLSDIGICDTGMLWCRCDHCGAECGETSETPEEAIAAWNRRAPSHAALLAEALKGLLHAVCGETGFANAVRTHSGHAYPWEALDIAEEAARAALEQSHGG